MDCPTLENPSVPDATAAPISSRVRKWITPLLIILGVQCWLVIGHGDYGQPIQQKLLLVAVGVALIGGLVPAVNRAATIILERIRHPSPGATWIGAVVIFLLATLYFPFTGWRQGRDFSP